MQLEQRLEAALQSEAPRARLARLMGELLEQGLERDEIFTTLQTYSARLHAAGRLEHADLLLETLDGFTGWCSP
jgi:hypothetical protein